jgi:LasA protease
MATRRITRTHVSKLVVIILVFILAFQSAACARVDIIYPSEETATAVALLNPASGGNQTAKLAELEPTSTNTPPPSATLEPSGTPTTAPTDTPTPQPTSSATATATLPANTATLVPTGSTAAARATSTGIGGQSSNSLSIITAPILYYTQPGDTLEALSKRFGVEPDQIAPADSTALPSNTLLQNKTLVVIPDVLDKTTRSDRLFPDSEIIYSPSAIGFNAGVYVSNAGGYLAKFREWRTDGWYNGGEVIQRVANENSVNPRFLLALVEYQCGWVLGALDPTDDVSYPLGYVDPQYRELYKQLTWALMEANIGYYGWRAGKVTELTFPDGSTLRLAPDLNAGTVAVMYLFSKIYNQPEWNEVLYGPDNFFDLYNAMFDDAWMRAKTVEPFFPTDLTQPELVLPFEVGKSWTLTSGPHAVWGPEGVLGAIDLAPPTAAPGCLPSDEWVTASAAGVVTRSENGAVVVDLDGDGYEQTGWAVFYMHISHEGRVQVGDWVNTGDHIGHPSCEGGVSTGTHLHIARKYNGEWIPADGPLPFNLGGWIAHEGEAAYYGTLTRGDAVITSDVNSSYISKITREK